jgi:hypothetical protein
MSKCQFCKQEKELRPYGPKGECICFECMTSTPEMEAAAKIQFSCQLESSGCVAVIGTEAGPHPLEHSVLRSFVRGQSDE